MRWHRLQILLDMVSGVQDEFGSVRCSYCVHIIMNSLQNDCVCGFRYFLVDADGNVLLSQEGIFRSNCMDCLDRTNVIQSLLGRRSLQSQLQVQHLTLTKTALKPDQIIK